MEPRFSVMVILLLWPALAEAVTVRHYQFKVVMANYTKMCSTKPIITVNGKFPGPTLRAREGDNVLVRVINEVHYNVTIHWHGVRQLRTGWSDGPAYITQCPIQPGQSYIYNFTITGQRGTLFWHAHISWLRATLHGAIVLLPKKGTPYPFPSPAKEKILIFGEWWKADTEAEINQATQSGMPPNVSDAHTINGLTGPIRNCSIISSQDTYTLHVERNKTYLLRIINAAINDELFFKIAEHRFTVVEVDASYTKPFTTDIIYLAPGQTTNALLNTGQVPVKYLIAISSFMDAPIGVDNLTNYGFLRYKHGLGRASSRPPTTMPPLNSTTSQLNYTKSLRSLNSIRYPTKVPLSIDHSLLFTMSVGVDPCGTCKNGTRLVGAMNNVTFTMPTIPLLQAHHFNISGVFTDDFPAKPPTSFNYTGNFTSTRATLATMNGTKVYRLRYNVTVEVVLQGTSIIAPESHPTHLHGFNFFVVGMGKGNYNASEDPKNFNLVDPVERNTIDVPTDGWVAIRFRADNPGIWLMHCHLEVHTSWGLKMAFLVENGEGPDESITPPPKDLPKC